MRPRLALLVLPLVLAAAPTLAAVIVPPAQRSPRLAYVTGNGTGTDHVWIADANGANRRRVGVGDEPLLAPDGTAIGASVFGDRGPALVLFQTATAGVSHYFDLRRATAVATAWSPESRFLAVQLFSVAANGSGGGLAVIDTSTGKAKTIARGAMCGASFAPDLPDRLVYARAPTSSNCFDGPVDVYSIAVDGSGRRRLTHDGRSLNPVWGAGTVAFDRQTPRRHLGPIYQVWLMHPDGTHRAQLTHLHVPPLLDGLVPLQFSADGEHLLARYEGQDTTGAWTIAVATHHARELKIAHQSLEPGGISLDGKLVLVDFGGFMNPPSTGRVEAIPFGGGHPKVLVAHGGQPSWNR
jgi:hypothetical protein